MSQPVVLDLETQKKFQDVGGDVKKLKVSVVGVYDYASDRYLTYREHELPDLFTLLERASSVIGYNVRKFDMQVLSPYYLGKIEQFKVIDLLEDVEKALGHRVALDDLIRATLGMKKGGHGLLAIEFFQDGKWDELCEYCLSDVKATKELYEYGLKNKKVLFQTHQGVREIPVKFLPDVTISPVSLSLPF